MAQPISFTAPAGQINQWAAAAQAAVAKAATAAVTDAGNIALREARADMAAAGFSRKWQSALKLDVFPKGRDSLDAAAVLRSKISYAGIFEEGGQIAGDPLLWLPIEKNLPLRLGAHRWTPSLYAQAFGPSLRTIRRGGNQPPLLGGLVSVGQFGGALAQPTRGKKRRDALARANFAKARKVFVPLFVGISTVNIAKRFHFREIVERAVAQLGALFEKHLGS